MAPLPPREERGAFDPPSAPQPLESVGTKGVPTHQPAASGAGRTKGFCISVFAANRFSVYAEDRVSVNTERRVSVIIAVVNQKGGAGKTTIALNLSAALAEEGKRVLLIDADPQQTAQDWAAIRQTPLPFQVLGLAKPVLHRDLPQLTADYDHIVIDGAPRNYEVARSAIAAADVVLIPVQPSGADFWASRETVNLVKEMHSFKETQKSVFVVSRKIGRTMLGRDIAEALADFGVPILTAGTTQRVIYAETLTAGTTVIEQQPKGAAAAEIRSILAELREAATPA